MTDVFDVLLQNILPIFLVAALGFWLRRYYALDTRTLSGLVFNALSPCLIFSSLTTTILPAAELGRLALFAFLSIVAMGGVALLAGRLLRLPRTETIVLMLTLMFVNGGNYGLTLNQLRYGDEGLSRAIVYYVVSTILVYSIGVVLASMGHVDLRTAVVRLLRVPALYAVILAVVVLGLDLTVPVPLARGIQVAGAGAIPVMLVVLGMNMADLRGFSELRLAVPATALRLLAGPIVAVALAAWLGLQGLSRSTSIIEASMPAAVITTVLATEFDVCPAAVTGIVALSTVVSPISLTAVIYLLGI